MFVTHDQDEALVMSDRIAVMNQGRIEQIGGPEELYERPRTRFVADFLGVREPARGQVLESATDAVARVRTEGGLAFDAGDDGGYRAGATRVAGAALGAHQPGRALRPNAFEGTIDDEIYLGDWTEWRVRAGRRRC